MPPRDPAVDMLRHTIATLAYRGAKAVRNAPDGFQDFRVADKTRTPGEILAHMGDLLDWALSIARGKEEWRDSQPGPWNDDVQRFFGSLAALDDYLASAGTLASTPERLFQGPIADALTHVGQIALLRRMAGSPVRGENYSRAEIVSGCVGPLQPAPSREFE